jgi:hypothetical protein
VSLFALSPEIEEDEVKVGSWAKPKKTFYSEKKWKNESRQSIVILIVEISTNFLRHARFPFTPLSNGKPHSCIMTRYTFSSFDR